MGRAPVRPAKGCGSPPARPPPLAMPVAANAARAGPAPSAAAWEWCRSAGACARPGLRPAASQALAAPARPGSLEDLRLRYERLRAAGRRSMEYLRLRLRYERLRAAGRR